MNMNACVRMFVPPHMLSGMNTFDGKRALVCSRWLELQVHSALKF